MLSEEKLFSIDLTTGKVHRNEDKPKYVDLTPTWSAIMPLLIMTIEEKTAGYSLAVAELKRLAKIADSISAK